MRKSWSEGKKAIDFNFGFNGFTFINDQFEINYCPMCGRKL